MTLKNDHLDQLCQFNFFPIQYMHSSWYESIPQGELINRLRHCERSKPELSEYIMEYYSLKGDYEFNFPVFLRNIIILDSVNLLKLILFFSACINTKKIQRLINGHKVREIWNEIGEDAYIYGLKRAPYITQDTQFKNPPMASNIPLGQYIISSGVYCFMSILNGYSSAIKQRMLFKLPQKWSQHVPLESTEKNSKKIETILKKVYADVSQMGND